MTRHIHIEMIGGLAGDMFLAAALDAGLVDKEALQEQLSRVGLGPIRVEEETVRRHGMRATHVRFGGWDPSQERDHRHLSQIEEMLRSSDLDDAVKAKAIEMFTLLGEVESHAHDIPLETVHFHEIGAIDSILDFVGAAFVVTSLDATWSAGKVPHGEGMIETSHGPMPALAPATARLLRGFELEARHVQGELVTPTGATLLRLLGLQDSALPSARMVEQGYGAGTKDFSGFANIVRLSLLDVGASQADLVTDTVVRLSADIDDQTPEGLAHTEAILFEAGGARCRAHAGRHEERKARRGGERARSP